MLRKYSHPQDKISSELLHPIQVTGPLCKGSRLSAILNFMLVANDHNKRNSNRRPGDTRARATQNKINPSNRYEGPVKDEGKRSIDPRNILELFFGIYRVDDGNSTFVGSAVSRGGFLLF